MLIGTKGLYKDKILYDYTQIELNKKEEEFNRRLELAKRENDKYIPYTNYYLSNFNKKYITGYEMETEKKYIDDKYIDVYIPISEIIHLTKEEYRERIGF